MMRFNINACLIFDAADGSLTSLDNATSSSQLSVTASALLLFFLQNSAVVNREEVLKRVWDDHGHTSSNSNLNQYLSMLRKTFRMYGIDNVILSISRGNLQLNPAINVEVLAALVNASRLKTPNDIHANPNALPQTKPTLGWTIASLVLIFFSAVLIAVTFFSGSAVRSITLTRLLQGECELSATEDMLTAFNPIAYETNFNAVRKRLNIACRPGRKFIFYYDDKLQKRGLGRVFLAHCAKQQNNDFSYCDNYFYYAWNPQ